MLLSYLSPNCRSRVRGWAGSCWLSKGSTGSGIPRDELEQNVEFALTETMRLAEVERDEHTRAEALVIRTDSTVGPENV